MGTASAAGRICSSRSCRTHGSSVPPAAGEGTSKWTSQRRRFMRGGQAIRLPESLRAQASACGAASPPSAGGCPAIRRPRPPETSTSWRSPPDRVATGVRARPDPGSTPSVRARSRRSIPRLYVVVAPLLLSRTCPCTRGHYLGNHSSLAEKPVRGAPDCRTNPSSNRSLSPRRSLAHDALKAWTSQLQRGGHEKLDRALTASVL
jgi:hypothetical protein